MLVIETATSGPRVRCYTSLRLPPARSHIEIARAAVHVAARRVGLDGARLHDLCVAVSEAVTNAVLAHERLGSTATVTVSFGASDDDMFEVVVRDQGPGFAPMSAAEWAAASNQAGSEREGGFGVMLMRALADEVEFVRGSGMTVCLRFRSCATEASEAVPR